MRSTGFATIGLVVSWAAMALGAGISNPAAFPLPHSPYVAVRAQVDLPADGLWNVRGPADQSVQQLYLIPPPEAGRRLLGRRMAEALRQQRIDTSRWRIRMLHQACLQYARTHAGSGPASVDDLDREQFRYVVDSLQEMPWGDWDAAAEGERPEGPFVFLVPKARFHFLDDERQAVPAERRELLAMELRPYVNDGEHWVLYTDGACVREAIDKQRIERYGLKIRPVVDVAKEEIRAMQSTLTYVLVAVCEGDVTEPFDVRVFNSISGDERTVSWAPSSAPRDESVLASLRDARRVAWQPYLRTGPAPVLRNWLSNSAVIDRDEVARPGDSLTAFSLLGGRAAVEETLQLQNLRPALHAEAATIDVGSLPGVQVEAHPYAEMLGDQPGGRLDLADVVPPDRFFVYVAKPASLLPFLDKGSEFIAATGASLTGNRLDYDLTRRYFERLGVTRAWLEAVLQSGTVRDLAVALPDLFLIDGTDITVVARLEHPELLGALLRLVGAGDLAEGGVLAVDTRDGRAAHWAWKNDLLCISTHRSELDHVLRLIDAQGEGSLGRSAEFRYMLTQMPVQPETRLLAYFSDPFVRRIVGPGVKLGQLRRMQARATMEALTAQSLLARLDGVPAVDSVAELVRMKYLPADFPAEDYSIGADGVVQSATYGSLSRLKTLQEVPVERVSSEEAKAYKQYVDNYARYWRRFFDPIAVRLDDTPDGALELSTFILPLIDNSIYNRLRETLLRHEDRKSLRIPHIEPAPVLQLSANLRDEFWQNIARNFSEFFRRYGGASPALLDDLGPSAHLAVFDADPVIALGSGDVMGAFSGNALRAGGDEMLMIPVALSLLTRPCTILVETRDPERTARYLRQAASGWAAWSDRGNDELQVSFYQVGDRDSWVWNLSVVGLIKLRFGVEVTDRYLVIRNIPWSVQDHVVHAEELSLNGAALSVWPGACRLQLPGLFASASDQERRAAMSGLGRLYPLIVSGVADVDSAGREHAKRFGFQPLHPPAGQWVWQDGNLASSLYGSGWRQRQPSYDPQRRFGLMQTIESMQVNMQFEDAGLRSTIRWKLRKEQ